MYRYTRVASLALAALFVVSCEKSDDDAIATAQLCLDKANTSSDATACLTKISGIDSARANRVRCGIHFLEGGLNKERFKQAYIALKNVGSSDSQTLTMMKYLALSPSSLKDALKAACAKSGMAGMARLGDMAFAATDIATTIGQTPCQADNPASCDWSGISGATISPAVGQVVIDMANSSCNSNQGTPPSYCNEVNAALQGGATATDVANCLKKKLQNPNATCP